MSRYEGGDHQAGSNDAQVLRAERHPREHVTAVSEDDRSHKVTLTVPLSVCTADLGHLPSKDIEKWFARKASVRHKAVNKKGRIPRPLNAFMLYRSAFIERARAWCGQNKQQFLSQVIATSWRMESADVQQRYKRYAERERLNHYKAHPTYKFSPRRPDSAGRKGQERFIEDQHSDLPLESNEQERLPTTINSSVVSKTVDCRAVYRSDFPSLVTPQPSPLETMIGLSPYEYQRCYWSAYDSHSEQTFGPMDTSMANFYDAERGTYFASPDGSHCVYFPCMHYGQSTYICDSEHSSVRISPTIML
jgi:hypothetical protein